MWLLSSQFPKSNVKIIRSGVNKMKYLRRLRDLREDKDLKQKDIAKIIQTTTQYYQKYENGIRPLTIERLELLADFYNTSTDYILGRTNNSAPYPKK